MSCRFCDEPDCRCEETLRMIVGYLDEQPELRLEGASAAPRDVLEDG